MKKTSSDRNSQFKVASETHNFKKELASDNSKSNGTSKKGKSPLGKAKPLGPVTNLEEYVDSDWWSRIFNSLYLKTDGDVVDDQKITKNEVDSFVKILQFSPEDKILDLCCGQGRHSLELARRGFKYVEGLDRSCYLVQKARGNAKREGLSIKLREGDARKLPYSPDTFDVVLILGNSFGFFETVQDDLKVLKEVFRVLKPWGKLMIDVADGEFIRTNFRPRSWEWIDKKHFVCRERSFSADNQKLISREVVAHVEKGVVADQFYAERLYSRENLANLLSEVGFSEISLQGEILTDSQRNQDLGMMEKRIIAMGVVRKKWTPIKTKPAQDVKNVAVILGDPGKPDILKPDNVFDDDDLYTIDRLKEALLEIKGYRFTYLSDHDTLMSDLLKLRGKVDYVFNLCDEGYLNDARKELHIPALLEMLNIPYTGSGPQCLAYCYDKALVRDIAEELGIPVAKGIFIKPEDTTFERRFTFPAIVKPNFGDSSFGITQRNVVNNVEELLNAIVAIRQQFGYDKPMLVEEFLPGKELSVGIIGNLSGSYTILPIIEEDYSILPEGLPRICGYEAKWMPDSPYWNLKSIPAEIPEEVEKTIIESCVKLFERFACRDYSRFDWRLDAKGQPRMLEVNPNAGWCWDGHLAKMVKVQNMIYSEMLGTVLQAAEKRMGIF